MVRVILQIVNSSCIVVQFNRKTFLPMQRTTKSPNFFSLEQKYIKKKTKNTEWRFTTVKEMEVSGNIRFSDLLEIHCLSHSPFCLIPNKEQDKQLLAASGYTVISYI